MRKNLKEARQKAGMTQQQMADKLNIGIRQYQRIESGVANGTFEIWDALEDMTGIHQRQLREILDKSLVQEENQRGRPKSQQPQSKRHKEAQWSRSRIVDRSAE